MKHGVLHAVALSAVIGISQLATAQVNQGQIAGTVTDPTGAAIPKAIIEAKNRDTGSTYTATSGGDGGYRFPDLAIGTYNVTAHAPGFGNAELTGVVVQIGSTTALPLRLQVGEATQSVTVNASAETVQSDSSDIGGVITEKQIAELPLALGGLGQFRAIESFAFLVPGTVGPGTATNNQGPNAAQGAGIYLSKLGGGQNFGAQVYLDGATTYREENGSTFDEISPSVEAISQFKVTTSTPEAQFGRTSGGIENFATKSGTNQYHGTVFDIFRNTALDANEWFSNGYLPLCKYDADPAGCAANNRRALDLKNDYGVDLGGPVAIPHLLKGNDRLFFFFAFEQFAKKQSATARSTVPTALMRTGDFSELLLTNPGPTGQTNPCTGTQNVYGEIFDPSTTRTVNGVPCRSPFMYNGKLNVINPAAITALGKNIIAAYPMPQSSGLSDNYIYRSVQNLHNTTDTIRVDANVTDKLRSFVSYSARENTVPFGGSAPLYPTPSGANLIQDFSTHLTRVGLDYVISPNVINSFTFGVNRLKNFDLSSEITNGVNYGTQLGIAGINSTAFPNIVPQDGISPLGAALNSDHTELHFLVNDAVSWVKGRNSFQFGVNYRYTQFVATSAGNANGQFYGYNAETAAEGNFYAGQANGTGFGLAGLELGLPDYIRYITPSDPKWITNYVAGYMQDNLKVSKNLTLNLGFRYEVDTPRHEARNQTSNFSASAIDPKNGRPGALIFGTTCKCNTAWANTYYKDLGPRLGFAYTPPNSNGKTVIRGGGAILYAPILYADFGTDMLQGYIYSLGVGGDGFKAAGDLNKGIPNYPAPPNLDPGQMDTGNAAGPQEVEDIQPSFGRNGMVSEWSLQVQQELARNLIFSIGYIGQAGQNLPSFLLQPNNFATKYLSLGNQLFSTNLAGAGVTAPYTGFNGSVGQALRPFPQYGNLRTPSDIENVGHTRFDAMVVSLSHHSGYGLTFDASYTWSKTITDADSAIGGINGGTPGLVQDSSNLKTAKSISIQDIPNNFVLNYLYELPVGRGKQLLGHANRLVDSLIGGWSVGGIQRYLSGVPFSFGCSNTGLGPIGYNDCISLSQVPGSKISSGLTRKTIKPFAYLGPQKYSQLGKTPAGPDPRTDSIFNGLNYFGTNAGYQALNPNPAFFDQNFDNPAVRNGGAFRFGTLPRVTGVARNFAYLQEDLVLIKNTPIFKERYQFQFKTECLDCFNRHNFNAPDSNAHNGDFGVPTSVVGGKTDGMRRLQLTARISF